MSGFSAMWRATWMQILTDKAVLLVMIGAIILYSFFYPMGYREQVAHELPIVVIDQEQSPLSRELIRYINAQAAVRVVAYPLSMAQAESFLLQGKADGIVWIKKDLMHSIYRVEQGQVALLANGAYLGRASTILLGLSDAITAFAKDIVVKQATFTAIPHQSSLMVVQRPLFNTLEGYGSAIVPAVAILIIHQTLLIGMGVMLGTWREQQGPLHYSFMQILGIASACMSLGLLNVFYYTGFVFWFHDYPRAGNFWASFSFSLFFLLAVVSLGLFLGSFFQQRERAYQVVTITSPVLFFLSGLSWPPSAIPEPLQFLSMLLPSSAGIMGLVKLNQMGAHWIEVQQEVLQLMMQILLFGGMALWRYKAFRPQT